MKRLVPVVIAGIAVIAVGGCSKSNGPAAPIAGVDKARAVQQQSDQHSQDLEKRIDGMTP